MEMQTQQSTRNHGPVRQIAGETVRVKRPPRHPAGPRGQVQFYDRIVYDIALHGTGNQALRDGEGFFASEQRCSNKFLCNLKKPRELPFGSKLEVGGVSLHMEFLDGFEMPEETDGEEREAPVTAFECYYLLKNYGYFQLVKDDDNVIERLPVRNLFQYNPLTGNGAPGSVPTYALQRGINLFAEPIILTSGEMFKFEFKWAKDPGGRIDAERRFNSAAGVAKEFGLNLHAKVIELPTRGR